MNPIEIENIDDLRQREGIDDVELHQDIRRLRIGDQVRVTFLSGPTQRETLPVRITSIQGRRFRGRLARRPARPDLGLRAEALVSFNAGQIHSIACLLPLPAVKKRKTKR